MPGQGRRNSPQVWRHSFERGLLGWPWLAGDAGPALWGRVRIGVPRAARTQCTPCDRRASASRSAGPLLHSDRSSERSRRRRSTPIHPPPPRLASHGLPTMSTSTSRAPVTPSREATCSNEPCPTVRRSDLASKPRFPSSPRSIDPPQVASHDCSQSEEAGRFGGGVPPRRGVWPSAHSSGGRAMGVRRDGQPRRVTRTEGLLVRAAPAAARRPPPERPAGVPRKPPPSPGTPARIWPLAQPPKSDGRFQSARDVRRTPTRPQARTASSQLSGVSRNSTHDNALPASPSSGYRATLESVSF